MMMKPLLGITVLDLSHILSGPFCTMHLADNGARVIKVERSKGDDTRSFGPFHEDGSSAYFHSINRGKESICLDLKNPKDRVLFEKILEKADVLVENFRPGTMAKLGYAPKDLLKKHPRLIVCSISGYGQTGPMAEEGAYDSVVQGLAGVMSFTGSEDGDATRLGLPICDLSSGIYAFGAICSALVGRSQTGKGTIIDISMLDSVFTLLENGLMNVFAKGESLKRVGNRHHSITPFDTFKCKDKPLIICCANESLFSKLLKVLGLENLAGDPRFETNTNRTINHDKLKAILEKTLMSRDADEWLADMKKAGIPAGYVNDVSQAAASAQIKARDMVVDSGGKPVHGTPFKYGSYDNTIAQKCAPSLDEDRIALEKEFG